MGHKRTAAGLLRYIGIVFFLFCFQEQVWARTVEEKIVLADFVFEGVVVDVQGRFATTTTAEEGKVPYTFVTYRIIKVMKGNYNQPLTTLRFMGGVGEDGNVMMVAGQPLFDRGDHDLLMVKGNNLYPCPLVECAQGRYRYLGGMVVNEGGQRVYIDKFGNIVSGETVDSEDVNVNQMSDDVTIERREFNESDPSEVTNVTEAYPEATPADPAGFTEAVDEKIRQTYNTEQLDMMPEFQSADPDATFTDPTNSAAGATQAAPPALDPALNPAIPEDERLELEWMEKQQQMNAEKYDTPEFKAAQQALSAAMEKQHPGFSPGTEDRSVFPQAHAMESVSDVESGSKVDSGLSFGGKVALWVALVLFVTGIGVYFWLGWRERLSAPPKQQ